MKKTAILWLPMIVLVLSLSACGKKEAPSSASSSRSSSSSAVYTTSQQVSSTQTSSSSQPASSIQPAAQAPSMNVDEVSQGNYTSIVGTWRNSQGELVFDENGLVSETASLGQYGDFSSGVFTIGVGQAGEGGFALMMIPKGSVIPEHLFAEGSDTSDSSKDRMVGTQGLLLQEKLDPYYRVTE